MTVENQKDTSQPFKIRRDGFGDTPVPLSGMLPPDEYSAKVAASEEVGQLEAIRVHQLKRQARQRGRAAFWADLLKGFGSRE